MKLKEPIRKKMAVGDVSRAIRGIDLTFDSTDDLRFAGRFGKLTKVDGGIFENSYTLRVNPLYDFDEVVQYLREFERCSATLNEDLGWENAYSKKYTNVYHSSGRKGRYIYGDISTLRSTAIDWAKFFRENPSILKEDLDAMLYINNRPLREEWILDNSTTSKEYGVLAQYSDSIQEISASKFTSLLNMQWQSLRHGSWIEWSVRQTDFYFYSDEDVLYDIHTFKPVPWRDLMPFINITEVHNLLGRAFTKDPAPDGSKLYIKYFRNLKTKSVFAIRCYPPEATVHCLNADA